MSEERSVSGVLDIDGVAHELLDCEVQGKSLDARPLLNPYNAEQFDFKSW